ncbi:MAG: copper chaperone CopZ [Clostridiales bacterium]|nr:copper chaperone CopZ [Clostridiales bacterium]
MENVTLNVEGMSCEHCVRAIEGAVGALPGVSAVKADLGANAVSVAYDPAVSALGDIKREIEDQGYEVAG